MNVPVALGVGQASNYTIWGELCEPPGQHPSTVQFLLPGGTYGHLYWDFPYDPDRYSYLRSAVRAGYAAFDVDRIGTGQSSHPFSALVDTNSNAYVAHELVQDLRNGQVGNYPKIVTVGHSYGSITALTEASQFHDVDGVINTGILHNIAPVGAGKIALYLSDPAPLDSPRFSTLDVGYLTTHPDTRAPFFYNTANADPAVIAADEQTKETVTATELGTFPLTLVNGTTESIKVPVLVAVGQDDAIFCGLLGSDCTSSATVQAQEQSHYTPQACLQSYVLPNSGHDINLHLNSQDWYAVARTWMDKHFGTGSGPVTTC